MDKETENASLEVFQILRNIGCCLRCCMRFCDNISTGSYIDPIKYCKNKFASLFITDFEYETEKCITCLGILKNKTLEQCIEKTKSVINNSNSDCNVFTISLSTPVSIIIRDKAVFLHLKKVAPEFLKLLNISEAKKIHVKTLFKSLFIEMLENAISGWTESSKTDCDFIVDIEIDLVYPQDDEECLSIGQNNSTPRKKKFPIRFGRKKIEEIVESISDSDFSRFCAIPPTIPINPITIGKITMTRSSIFVGGRYTKLSRKISQTPWFVNGVCKNDQSVQDLLCRDLQESTQAEDIKFASSGREDVDVRMLKLGRPFSIELVNPKIAKNLKEQLPVLKKKINNNSDIVKIVSDLKILSKNDLCKLKEGENLKKKVYRALCIFKDRVDENIILNKINSLEKIKIVQKTPVRVLHRRPLKSRERYIYKIRGRIPTREEWNRFTVLSGYNVNETSFLIIDLKTQAGTYVKEFVHGDFGRTVPSLSKILGVEMDMIALDVMEVDIDWP